MLSTAQSHILDTETRNFLFTKNRRERNVQALVGVFHPKSWQFTKWVSKIFRVRKALCEYEKPLCEYEKPLCEYEKPLFQRNLHVFPGFPGFFRIFSVLE